MKFRKIGIINVEFTLDLDHASPNSNPELQSVYTISFIRDE